MSEIRTYVLVDRYNEYASEEFDTLDEARNAAAGAGGGPHAIVALVYTFEDSELIETPATARGSPRPAEPSR